MCASLEDYNKQIAELRQEARAMHELDDWLRADVGAYEGLTLQHTTHLFTTKHSTTAPTRHTTRKYADVAHDATK